MASWLGGRPNLYRIFPKLGVTARAGLPDVVSVAEGWTTERAHAAFFASEPAQAFVAVLRPLLHGESQYTDAIPVGGKPAFAEVDS
ncbi:hypothetical protein [Cryptosporangium japonicum]|uniref:Uncharacterized protein n=1 Tax=Cryptosporangium japonicum TaxID=80872 RepID=A0ABN0TS77_9ACTN